MAQTAIELCEEMQIKTLTQVHTSNFTTENVQDNNYPKERLGKDGPSTIHFPS